MKNVIVSAAVILMASLSVKAQEIPERETGESKPIIKEKIVNKKERDNLQLTDAQKVQLKSMNEDLRKKMDDLRKQDNLTVKEYREKMDALRTERQSQFQSILTDQQKSQMQKDKEANKARAEQFGKKRQAKMKEELNLTDDQMAKMNENRKASMEKINSIRDDKSLNEGQKKDQIKEIMKAQREKTKSILTKEQQKKMKELHKGHHKKRTPTVS